MFEHTGGQRDADVLAILERFVSARCARLRWKLCATHRVLPSHGIALDWLHGLKCLTRNGAMLFERDVGLTWVVFCDYWGSWHVLTLFWGWTVPRMYHGGYARMWWAHVSMIMFGLRCLGWPWGDVGMCFASCRCALFTGHCVDMGCILWLVRERERDLYLPMTIMDHCVLALQ